MSCVEEKNNTFFSAFWGQKCGTHKKKEREITTTTTEEEEEEEEEEEHHRRRRWWVGGASSGTVSSGTTRRRSPAGFSRWLLSPSRLGSKVVLPFSKIYTTRFCISEETAQKSARFDDEQRAQREKSGEAEDCRRKISIIARRKSLEKKKRVQQLDDTSGTQQGVFAREICLFAPSTLDRLKSVLPRLAQTWSGTMSVAVLASEEDVRREIFGTSNREFTTRTFNRHRGRPIAGVQTRFPVNALRNLALSGCKRTLNATYVVLHDVDFEIFPNAPSKELLEEIEEVLKPNAKHGLVLPSFTAG